MTTYYVTTSGSDSNNGLTEGTAFATPGYAAGQATAQGDVIYIKSGTYTLSTTSSNVSGGWMSLSRGVLVEGYQTTAGDQGTRPVINAGSQAVGQIVSTPSPGSNVIGSVVSNIEVNGTNTATTGINVGGNYDAMAKNCVSKNCTTYGFIGGICVNCHAESSPRGYLVHSNYFCTATLCSFAGFSSNANGAAFVNCISYGNTGRGFFVDRVYTRYINCVAYNNSLDGFSSNSDSQHHIRCITAENGGYGIRSTNANSDEFTLDTADYNNVSGRTIGTNTRKDIRPITLTADPFVDAANLDFRINDVAGGGAELRQIQLSGLAGVNGVFDVGAIDAVVTAGGGGAVLHPLRSN